METLIRFNNIQNMTDEAVLGKYDATKTSILKYLFVEMKSDIVNTDVKDFFGGKKSVLSEGDKKKRTSYSKARKKARAEVDKMIASGKKMTVEEQTAAVKKRHDEYYAQYMK